MNESYKYGTVLLVDDNHIDNLIARKTLLSAYFAKKVLLMSSAQEAISSIRESVILKKEIPEVLFLDIRMPEMDGFNLLEELSLIDGLVTDDIKVYMLSSSVDPEHHTILRQNKMVTKFIGKPLTLESLETI